MNDENERYDDDKRDDGRNFRGSYQLPDYERLLNFPNFKNKLAKKLQVKLSSLITKKSLEENKPDVKRCLEYINFLNAEILLIQHLLDTKEINDDV